MRKISLFTSVALVSFLMVSNNPAEAGWSSSRSSSSSRTSFSSSSSRSSWSVKSPSSSGISGFGSKRSYSSSSTFSAPSSLSNKQSNSYFSSSYNRKSSTNSYNNYTKNNSYSQKSYNYPSMPSNTTSTVTKNVTIKKYYYGGSNHYYSVPSYYSPPHDHYGLFSGMFLGMMLSHAMEPSYYNWAYSHYNDPSYIAWHQDMMAQAQNNAELRQQLGELDAKVDSLRNQNAPVNQNVIQDNSGEQDPPIENKPSQYPTEQKPSNIPETHSALIPLLVGFGVFVVVVLAIVAILL